MNSKKELVKKPKAVAKPKPAKKTSVDKPKPAKKTSVDKPKAKPAKKASVAKPKPVAKPKAIRKVYIEQLNKKRNWKGGGTGTEDAEDLINIFYDVRKKYYDFLVSNLNIKNKTVSDDLLYDFVLNFFVRNDIICIEYNTYSLKDIIYISKNLIMFGINQTDTNKKEFIFLVSLFNIIAFIYDATIVSNSDTYYKEFIDRIRFKQTHDNDDLRNHLIMHLSKGGIRNSDGNDRTLSASSISSASIHPSISGLLSSQDLQGLQDSQGSANYSRIFDSQSPRGSITSSAYV